MLEFVTHLLDSSDFPARWTCGNWTAGHGWLHIVSDLGVWSAYFAIPCILGYFAQRRKDIPFRMIFWLFGAFILACGTTHLMEALMFWWPAYRLAGVIKLLTALVSWGTVAALVPTIPKALVLRTPADLQREIAGRKQAENALQKANAELERRVQERTAELAQANASLLQSQRREKERADELEAILRATPTPVWIAHDPQCHRITGNPASFELLGLPEGVNVSATSPDHDPGQRGFREYRGDQPIPVDELPIQRAARGDLVTGAEVKFVFDDGKVRYIYGNAVPLRHADGSVRGCVGAFADVTTLKEAEASLRRNQEIFKLVHQIGRIGHWEWNSLTDENQWSPEIEALYGLPPGGFAGGYQGWAKLVHPDDLPKAEADVRRALETGKYFTEFRVIWPDGSVRWLEARASVFADSHGKPVRIIGVNMDITERKTIEQALKDADRRKDEFLATLTHELRNPLAPIRNAVQMQVLKLKCSADPDVVSSRGVIDRQTQHMARLLDDLLDVSRITRNRLDLRKECVSLVAVVESAVETSRPVIDGGGHELTVALPPEPIHLDADPVRLAQVLANLLTNSAKYTDRGGRIRLTAEKVGHEVVVSVKDNGMGIAPDMLPRLFQIFAQAKPALARSQGGLGIGLALVKGLVEMHGGSVEGSSAGPGHGSEFTVRLPVAVTPEQREVPAAGVAAPSPVRCKIVVADDNHDAAYTLSLLLSKSGHEVCTASDGQEAVEVVKAFGPDVALLDIGMPKLNGYDAARRIRAQPWGKGVLLVALTGWGQEEDRQRSLEAGFDTHLVKPVSIPALEKLLATQARVIPGQTT
jgi:PAS domain S-box-containing protein